MAKAYDLCSNNATISDAVCLSNGIIGVGIPDLITVENAIQGKILLFSHRAIKGTRKIAKNRTGIRSNILPIGDRTRARRWSVLEVC